VSLLSVLTQEAEARKKALSIDMAKLRENAALLQTAMREIMVYCEQFGQQLEVLKMPSKGLYELPGFEPFRDLTMRQFRTVQRAKTIDNDEMYDYVQLSYYHMGDYERHCDIRHATMRKSIEERINQGSLKFTYMERYTPLGDPMGGRFTVPAQIVSVVRFTSQINDATIHLYLRNIESFELERMVIPATDVNQSLLDTLGLYILGHNRRFKQVGTKVDYEANEG
jgi:hypothetical protein